jgi:hypothetical protein
VITIALLLRSGLRRRRPYRFLRAGVGAVRRSTAFLALEAFASLRPLLALRTLGTLLPILALRPFAATA